MGWCDPPFLGVDDASDGGIAFTAVGMLWFKFCVVFVADDRAPFPCPRSTFILRGSCLRRSVSRWCCCWSLSMGGTYPFGYRTWMIELWDIFPVGGRMGAKYVEPSDRVSYCGKSTKSWPLITKSKFRKVAFMGGAQDAKTWSLRLSSWVVQLWSRTLRPLLRPNQTSVPSMRSVCLPVALLQANIILCRRPLLPKNSHVVRILLLFQILPTLSSE